MKYLPILLLTAALLACCSHKGGYIKLSTNEQIDALGAYKPELCDASLAVTFPPLARPAKYGSIEILSNGDTIYLDSVVAPLPLVKYDMKRFAPRNMPYTVINGPYFTSLKLDAINSEQKRLFLKKLESVLGKPDDWNQIVNGKDSTICRLLLEDYDCDHNRACPSSPIWQKDGKWFIFDSLLWDRSVDGEPYYLGWAILTYYDLSAFERYQNRTIYTPVTGCEYIEYTQDNKK